MTTTIDLLSRIVYVERLVVERLLLFLPWFSSAVSYEAAGKVQRRRRKTTSRSAPGSGSPLHASSRLRLAVLLWCRTGCAKCKLEATPWRFSHRKLVALNRLLEFFFEKIPPEFAL